MGVVFLTVQSEDIGSFHEVMILRVVIFFVIEFLDWVLFVFDVCGVGVLVV